MTAKSTTVGTTRKGGAACAAPLDPTLLTFEHDHTFQSNGHLVLTVTYPSTSTPGKRYTLAVRDEGTLITAGDHDETCPGFLHYGACLHTRGTAEMVREYWRRHFQSLPRTDLLRESSWLAHQPALDTAQQLQSDALSDVIAARFIAKHGRVPEAQAGAA